MELTIDGVQLLEKLESRIVEKVRGAWKSAPGNPGDNKDRRKKRVGVLRDVTENDETDYGAIPYTLTLRIAGLLPLPPMVPPAS